MKDQLHITNGSNSVDLLNAAGIQGHKFSWDDILHEGPVPEGLSLTALSDVRAEYIVSLGFGNPEQIRQKFEQRDEQLISAPQYKNITLWFEHDLYDQLQLLQLLDWFAKSTIDLDRLSIIQTDKHLGHHRPNEIEPLVNTASPISQTQLDLAQDAWAAFTSSDPERLNQVLNKDLSALPFLKPALVRLSREYPDSKTGLPLTEKMILDCLALKPQSPVQLFRLYTQKEEAEFMGDSTFFIRLNQMGSSEYSLVDLDNPVDIMNVRNESQDVAISDYGHQVLAGKAHWFSDNGLSKSVGGYEISPTGLALWDQDKNKIIYKN